jgi:hypothetical protein
MRLTGPIVSRYFCHHRHDWNLSIMKHRLGLPSVQENHLFCRHGSVRARLSNMFIALINL